MYVCIMYVCMLCMNVCMYVCMYECIYVCMCVGGAYTDVTYLAPTYIRSRFQLTSVKYGVFLSSLEILFEKSESKISI